MQISKRCSIAIHCLICVCEFGESKKVTSELLSLSTGVNPVSIRNIVSALKKEGILSVKAGTGGATLCCPPEEITLYRICKALDPDFLAKLIGIHSAPSPLCPVGRSIRTVLEGSYERIYRDLQTSLRTITLKEILERYHGMQ